MFVTTQCIIFIRDKNAKGQEISGYIDYALRLKSEPFEAYFERKKKLLPKASDLSYYNWETQTSTSNSTPNFQVIADSETGLLFKNKRDRKVINVDPKVRPASVLPGSSEERCRVSRTSTLPLTGWYRSLNASDSLLPVLLDVVSFLFTPQANPGDNSTRSEIKTKEFQQVVIYDHMTRRKT